MVRPWRFYDDIEVERVLRKAPPRRRTHVRKAAQARLAHSGRTVTSSSLFHSRGFRSPGPFLRNLRSARLGVAPRRIQNAHARSIGVSIAARNAAANTIGNCMTAPAERPVRADPAQSRPFVHPLRMTSRLHARLSV